MLTDGIPALICAPSAIALLNGESPRGLPIALVAWEVSGMDTMADPVITGTNGQSRLVRALANPALYGPGCTAVRIVETHISYVLLTGRHAYKIIITFYIIGVASSTRSPRTAGIVCRCIIDLLLAGSKNNS